MKKTTDKTTEKPTTKRVAYIAVIVPTGYKLGLAEEGVAGYNPFPDDHDYGGHYNDYEHAKATAAECNKRLGLTEEEAFKISASSIGASMKPVKVRILDVGAPGAAGSDHREEVLWELRIADGYATMHDGVATKTLLELLDNWTSQIREGGWKPTNDELLKDIEETRSYVNGALDRLRDHLKETA